MAQSALEQVNEILDERQRLIEERKDEGRDVSNEQTTTTLAFIDILIALADRVDRLEGRR